MTPDMFLNIFAIDPQEKVWGDTTPVSINSTHEVHFLNIKRGGYSSRHRHEKNNLFYVVSGVIEVVRFDSEGQEKEGVALLLVQESEDRPHCA